MKIAHKSMLLVALMMLVLIIIGNLLFGAFFDRYLIRQEDDQIRLVNESIISYFEEKKAALTGAVNDWSWWDEAYAHIDDPDSGFIEQYTLPSAFINYDINLLLMVRMDGSIVSDLYYDIANARFVETPAALIDLLQRYMPLYLANDDQAAVLKIGSRYFMIVSSHITDTAGIQPANGVMIFGREIDGAMLGRLGGLIGGTVSMASQDQIHHAILHPLLDGQGLYMTQVRRGISDNTIRGHILLSERDGTAPAILTYRMDRAIYGYGMGQIRRFQSVYTAFIIALIALYLLFMGSFVVRPIRALTLEIADLDIHGGKTSRLKIKGRDEIAFLGSAINGLLDRIQAEQSNLRRSEKRLLNAQSIAHVGNWELALDTGRLWLSEEAQRIFGFGGRTGWMTQAEIQRQMDPEDYTALERALGDMIEGNRCLSLEIPIKRIDDKTRRIFKFRAEPEYDAAGRMTKILGVIMDITSEKMKEADIIYLSHHDSLTGLYNRFFLEEELKRLDNPRQLPLSVIMGDINGLKLINDAFGHANGDMLLTDTAAILRQCSRSGDIVARTGGDEFCILLPNTSADTAQQICRRIYQACDAFNRENEREHSFVSISLGTGTKAEPLQYMEFIIREAEEAMYKHKLLDRKSMHSSIMTSIKATMCEKSFETQEHGDRLVRLSNRVGRAMDLTDEQFNDLELLAMLHDIGKIGIDSAILAKEGPLDEDEWAEMKRHPEIGFRIASVSPELASISEYILCHHERWDGKGYPQGLAGEEIPILSRIIAVVDSFDAMTQDRPYRKAMGREAAIRELRLNAGTQFDPEIVELFIAHALGQGTLRAPAPAGTVLEAHGCLDASS